MVLLPGCRTDALYWLNAEGWRWIKGGRGDKTFPTIVELQYQII